MKSINVLELKEKRACLLFEITIFQLKMRFAYHNGNYGYQSVSSLSKYYVDLSHIMNNLQTLHNSIFTCKLNILITILKNKVTQF